MNFVFREKVTHNLYLKQKKVILRQILQLVDKFMGNKIKPKTKRGNEKYN